MDNIPPTANCQQPTAPRVPNFQLSLFFEIIIMDYSKKVGLLVWAVVLFSLHAWAQKKQFTMAEATNGLTTTLAPKSIKNASWQPGTDNFWYTDTVLGRPAWIYTDFSKDDNAAPVTVMQGNYPVKLKAIPAIKWITKDNAYFINGKDVITGTLADDKWTWSKWITLPEKAANITADKSNKIAWTIDNNLWLFNGTSMPVTAEQNKNIVCGQSVHRDEFGIDHGIFFSPKGNYLAYYRMDQTMVNDYPIIRWDTVPATVNIIKYPMAGGTSHQVTLCVFDPATKKTVVLKTGETEKDHYLTCVTWSPDEAFMYIAILNRDQNHLWLNKYDARTGDMVKTLFEETDAKYVHPMHELSFIPGKDDEFIWWSERDGYEHLYRYNTDGKLIRQLTKGKWVVNELVGFNQKKNEAIITTSKESPLEKHIYKLDLNNGKMNRIDNAEGMHSATCSEDGKYIFDVYSSPGVAKNSVIRATGYSFDKYLERSPDPLSGYDRAQVRNVTLNVNSADGSFPLYGKLILPPNFDSTKKYPVIVYLYNGPNVQLIHNSFPASGNLWYEYMAQHGYIVFTMDGRGSWNRGLAFEQATFRHLGQVEMEDQMRGVDYLRSLRYVDTARMGVHGWSFGGFMTTSLMLKYPGVFKCAVAGGPVMDWKMYEVMYTERYMNRPDINPDGYADANLLDKVKNLRGKLLLIHGTDDNTVVWQHSIDFIKNCVSEGVQVDYFVYPGYEHNVRGKDRVHLMQKITDYFDQYLKP